MKPISDIRREKLAQIIAETGSQSAVASALGKDKNQIYQWLLDPVQPGARNIGTSSARAIESTFKKPSGWLDQDTAEQLIDEQRLASAISWLEADAWEAYFRLTPAQKAKLISYLCSLSARPSKDDLLALIALAS